MSVPAGHLVPTLNAPAHTLYHWQTSLQMHRYVGTTLHPTCIHGGLAVHEHLTTASASKAPGRPQRDAQQAFTSYSMLSTRHLPTT